MLIEYHILQNFAPHCLNRDDTNAPKDCVFGGFRRARISSQCQKRAIRLYPAFQELLGEHTSLRTKRLVENLTDKLVARGHDPEAAAQATAKVLELGLKLKTEKTGRTQYLLFLGKADLEELATALNDAWPEISNGKLSKLPPVLEVTVRDIRDRVRAVDLALFGRMVADLPEMNVDAACQVAHALSTNKVSMEMDFFTAVDDLQPDDDAGAGMLGVVEFNSSCFYRYAVLDFGSLRETLRDDALARRGIQAFTRAMIEAIPSGKQNTMAAHNWPDYVRVMVRKEGQACSLANAFLRPVEPNGKGSLMERSILALEEYTARLEAMYGQPAAALDFRASTVEGCGDGSLTELYGRLQEVL